MDLLRIFAYGTLKCGYWNHDRFCQGALEVNEARIRDRLYKGPGFPVLDVPDGDVLAVGTADPLADVATQARLSGRVGSFYQLDPDRATQAAWGTVYGELMTFDDSEYRLPIFDQLESFRPGSTCLYRRVLVRATVNGACKLAWVYTVAITGIKSGRIVSGRWPE